MGYMCEGVTVRGVWRNTWKTLEHAGLHSVCVYVHVCVCARARVSTYNDQSRICGTPCLGHQLSTSLGLKTSHVLSTQLPAGKYKDVDNTVTSSVNNLIGCQLGNMRI